MKISLWSSRVSAARSEVVGRLVVGCAAARWNVCGGVGLGCCRQDVAVGRFAVGGCVVGDCRP